MKQCACRDLCLMPASNSAGMYAHKR
ncbi:TPA: hypothetical protein ACFKZP_09205 [Neisseria gonorrhoeae]|uniref:Uncharacterized protein n=1 Tax=Neisseria gonorrhoeae TaxID=485 RepID=A0AAX2TP41_NEIGO|nr:hypothetical protein A6J43_13475 [Neisseria gonorrhoeae]AVH83015.1 hypothetical protein A6J46_13475 [Neisseria gonorrhoeae]AVI60047.1 hypothetical protein A6J44_13865 [Neisseria gonorrhoeae]AZG19559.1 hypothetical protein EGH15_06400 [Neisseria gonorrhoeae]AZG21808.1 hypothetical protein EGH12_04070 [Neisseria gonorrhoeae]